MPLSQVPEPGQPLVERHSGPLTRPFIWLSQLAAASCCQHSTSQRSFEAERPWFKSGKFFQGLWLSQPQHVPANGDRLADSRAVCLPSSGTGGVRSSSCRHKMWIRCGWIPLSLSLILISWPCPSFVSTTSWAVQSRSNEVVAPSSSLQELP